MLKKISIVMVVSGLIWAAFTAFWARNYYLGMNQATMALGALIIGGALYGVLYSFLKSRRSPDPDSKIRNRLIKVRRVIAVISILCVVLFGVSGLVIHFCSARSSAIEHKLDPTQMRLNQAQVDHAKQMIRLSGVITVMCNLSLACMIVSPLGFITWGLIHAFLKPITANRFNSQN